MLGNFLTISYLLRLQGTAQAILESTSFDISTKAHRSATVQFAFAKDRPTLPSRGKKNCLSIALFR